MLILPMILPLFGFVQSTKIPTAVLDLNEKFLDVMNTGYWFVKFYAPWCAHCKRLAPTWEHMGHALADINSQVRVGKVDCTRFPSVASTLGISGYPTLIFFRNGVRITYDGERRKKNMLEFAEKSAGPVVQEFTSLNKFYELKKSSDADPFFVYIKNLNAPLSVQASIEEEEGEEWVENSTVFKNGAKYLYKRYESIAEEFFTEVRFLSAAQTLLVGVKSFNIPEAQRLATDSIVVVKDNRYVFFDVAYPEHLRNWVGAERWPLLPQISAANIYTVANSARKKLVLMAGDATEMIGRQNLSSETGRFYSMFKKAANLTYNDEFLRNFFQFGWIDDVSLIKNVIMGEIELPNVLVLNLSSYEFYLNEDHADRITEHSLQTFLQELAAGNVMVRGGRSWPTRFRRMFYEVTSNVHDMFYHQPILTVCLFGVPLAFFSIIFYSVCSADFSVDRNEIYPEDEEDEDMEYDSDELHRLPNEKSKSDVRGDNAGSATKDSGGEEAAEDDDEYADDEEDGTGDSGSELLDNDKDYKQKKSD